MCLYKNGSCSFCIIFTLDFAYYLMKQHNHKLGSYKTAHELTLSFSGSGHYQMEREDQECY